MADVVKRLGVKDALTSDFKPNIQLTVIMTRRYIWALKLRAIWKVIRARVGE